MDISINRNSNINKAQFEQAAPTVQHGTKAERPVLSITHAPVAADGSMDIDVPESALTRTDPLGALISSAFNFQAPPMPKFE